MPANGAKTVSVDIAGQAALEPVQLEYVLVALQVPLEPEREVLPLQSVPAGMNELPAHRPEPSQFSATSHAPAIGRQTVKVSLLEQDEEPGEQKLQMPVQVVAVSWTVQLPRPLHASCCIAWPLQE